MIKIIMMMLSGGKPMTQLPGQSYRSVASGGGSESESDPLEIKARLRVHRLSSG